MALKITIRLSDDQEESLARFWALQSVQETSPVDGQPMSVNPYQSVEDLVIQTVQATVVKTAMDRCPPAAGMKDLQDLAKLRERIAARTKVELDKSKV
jgi:hypothetical protein